MTEDQIKHMVNRFLGWGLPKNFNPDAGISFKAEFNEHTAHPMKHEPVGTNLFDVDQATAMVSYMIEGLPAAIPSQRDLLRSPEYARLCGIAAAAEAIASVYPSRCAAPPTAKHCEDCHCGHVLLDRALHAKSSTALSPHTEKTA